MTKVLVLAALVAGTSLLVLALPLPYKDTLAAILDKRDLLRGDRSHRIVLVGGSGLYCGVDSGMIEQELGRPVVNMGLYYGFGVTPLLAGLNPFLHKGDVVVVIPEYSMFYDNYDEYSRKWIVVLGFDSGTVQRVYRDAAQPVKSLLRDASGLLLSKFEALPELARELLGAGRMLPLKGGYVLFSREFNAAGDSLKGFPSVPLRPAVSVEHLPSSPDYRDQSFAGLNAFCRESRGLGVATFFAFPAYVSLDYYLEYGRMKRFEERLRRELDCPILGSPEDFLYPGGHFLNTNNHLNAEGKRERTERLIELLREKLASGRRETAPAVSHRRSQ